MKAYKQKLREGVNQEQKRALNEAIGTENVCVSLCEDKHSIQAYFDKFLHADMNDPEIRDQVFEYFVDKVYLYDDKLVVSMWFSEDDKQEITWRDWSRWMSIGPTSPLLLKGEALSSTASPSAPAWHERTLICCLKTYIMYQPMREPRRLAPTLGILALVCRLRTDLPRQTTL